MTLPGFHIDPAVRALGVRGAFAILTDLDNTVPPERLAPWRAALAAHLDAGLAPGALDADPVLAGFRALHDRVGRSNRRFPASAEALLRLYERKRLVPAINPLVDLYNGVSLETRLSLGAHDLRAVTGDVVLRLTRGDERFVPLGATEPEPVPAGEYAYVDGSGEILCRLEHRQCERTKVVPATRDCFYILQGNAATPPAMIEAALARLVEVTQAHCGGRVAASWIVT